jgi:hypothetical protein
LIGLINVGISIVKNINTVTANTMKGRILTWTGEKGIIASEGQRFNFTIDNWHSDVAPKPDMQVKISVLNNELVNAQLFSDQEVIHEQVEKIRNSGSKVLTGFTAEVGKSIVVAYVLFAVGAFFFNVYSGSGLMAGLSINLPRTFGELRAFNTSGTGIFLTFVALASIALPFFWKVKHAYLGWALPLIVTSCGMLNFYSAYKTAKDSISSVSSSFLGNAFGSQVSEMANSMGSLYPGVGSILCLGAGIFLALEGYKKFKHATS